MVYVKDEKELSFERFYEILLIVSVQLKKAEQNALLLPKVFKLLKYVTITDTDDHVSLCPLLFAFRLFKL